MTACRWYEHGLKDNERRQAPARIWSKLSGAAKAVVRHLKPEDFSGGLDKLLDVLRTSPLQQLPVRLGEPFEPCSPRTTISHSVCMGIGKVSDLPCGMMHMSPMNRKINVRIHSGTIGRPTMSPPIGNGGKMKMSNIGMTATVTVETIGLTLNKRSCCPLRMPLTLRRPIEPSRRLGAQSNASARSDTSRQSPTLEKG